jgi:hypothetical protein
MIAIFEIIKRIHFTDSCLLRYAWMHRGSRGHDCMVVGFTTTCAISAYHHLSCEFELRSCQGVLDTILCDKV